MTDDYNGKYVKQLYDMTASAVAARDAMKEAVKRGTVTEYHRVLRSAPEVKLVSPLLGVRRRLNELSMQRRQASAGAGTGNVVTDMKRQNDVDEMTKALCAIAHGTLMWANEQLGRPVVPEPAAQALTAGEPTADEPAAEPVNTYDGGPTP